MAFYGIINKTRYGRDIALQIEGKAFVHVGDCNGRCATKQQRVPSRGELPTACIAMFVPAPVLPAFACDARD